MPLRQTGHSPLRFEIWVRGSLKRKLASGFAGGSTPHCGVSPASFAAILVRSYSAFI